MSTPVGPSGSSATPPPFNPGAGEMPPGKPLPPNNPWVKALLQMSPGISIGEAMVYASRLQDNMYKMLQNQIKEDDARRKKEQQIEKEMLGN